MEMVDKRRWRMIPQLWGRPAMTAIAPGNVVGAGRATETSKPWLTYRALGRTIYRTL